uniref:Uncharacterized protein n=1 Tax=Cucumis melo TaxID=3656 RepID=A0A9I9E671_CUCME
MNIFVLVCLYNPKTFYTNHFHIMMICSVSSTKIGQQEHVERPLLMWDLMCQTILMTVFPLVIHMIKTSQRCIDKEWICDQM